MHMCLISYPAGSTAIVSQFDSVNPYYWPGYFVAALAVLYGCIMLIFFRDIRPPPKLNQLKVKCQCLSGIKLTTQLQSNWKMQFVVSFTKMSKLKCIYLYLYRITIRSSILFSSYSCTEYFLLTTTSPDIRVFDILWISRWTPLRSSCSTHHTSSERPVWIHSEVYFLLPDWCGSGTVCVMFYSVRF